MKTLLAILNFLGSAIESVIDGLWYLFSFRFIRTKTKTAYAPELFPPVAPAKQPEAREALPAVLSGVSPAEKESLGVRYIVSPDIL